MLIVPLTACTYKVASRLPSLILNGLLSLPHTLISIRNRLLPVQPFIDSPQELPAPVTTRESKSVPSQAKEERHDSASSSEVEISSLADVESSTEDLADSAWVSLEEKRTDA